MAGGDRHCEALKEPKQSSPFEDKNIVAGHSLESPATANDYWHLLKPRVMSLSRFYRNCRAIARPRVRSPSYSLPQYCALRLAVGQREPLTCGMSGISML